MTSPVGWSSTSLEDLIGGDAPIVYGIIQAGPEVPNGVPYIRPTELVNGGIDIRSLKRTSSSIASKYSRSVLRAGDIVLAIVGTIGKLAVVPPELEGANITQSSARLRAPGFMPSAYLAAALQSPQLRAQFEKMEFGVAVRRLNIAHVRALQMPVAPAAEQRRIVAKLDEIFAQTRAARARLERLPALIEKLKRSILAAAFRGDLTKDWRAANPDVEPAPSGDFTAEVKPGHFWGSGASADRPLRSLPANWRWTRVRDLGPDAVQIGPMSMKSSEFTDSGTPVLNVGCVQWGRLDLSKLDHLPEARTASFDRYRIRADDILFTRSGTVGRYPFTGRSPDLPGGQGIDSRRCA